MSNMSTSLWSHIRTVQDFPKPGISFFDLTPLFMNNIGPLTDALIASIPEEKLAEVDSFVAVEASVNGPRLFMNNGVKSKKQMPGFGKFWTVRM